MTHTCTVLNDIWGNYHALCDPRNIETYDGVRHIQLEVEGERMWMPEFCIVMGAPMSGEQMRDFDSRMSA